MHVNHTTAPAAPDADFQAGRIAAHTWYTQAMKSAAEYRDTARAALVRDIHDEAEAAAASYLFNEGFAEGLARLIAGGAQ